MKKLLLISIVLISTIWLTWCGASGDKEVDTAVWMVCEMFTNANNMDMSKLASMSSEEREKLNKEMEEKGKKMEEVFKRLDTKYKWKEDKLKAIADKSFQKQCPKIWKKFGQKDGNNIFGR